jgi:hypothetical protein
MRTLLRWSLALGLLLATASPAPAWWWRIFCKHHFHPTPCPAPSPRRDDGGRPQASRETPTARPATADKTPSLGDPHAAEIQADFDRWNKYLGRTSGAPGTPAELVKDLQAAYTADAGTPVLRDRLASVYQRVADAVEKGFYNREFNTGGGPPSVARKNIKTGADVDMALDYFRLQGPVLLSELRTTQGRVKAYIEAQGAIRLRDDERALTAAELQKVAQLFRDAAAALAKAS